MHVYLKYFIYMHVNMYIHFIKNTPTFFYIVCAHIASVYLGENNQTEACYTPHEIVYLRRTVIKNSEIMSRISASLQHLIGG